MTQLFARKTKKEEVFKKDNVTIYKANRCEDLAVDS